MVFEVRCGRQVFPCGRQTGDFRCFTRAMSILNTYPAPERHSNQPAEQNFFSPMGELEA